jgi:serine/threonine protein kinase
MLYLQLWNTNMTLVMEYLSGGPVEWKNANDQPILLLKQTRRILRDVLLGLDYCGFNRSFDSVNSSLTTICSAP